jgi:DNA (cytosine-5)-methyltransferase 1
VEEASDFETILSGLEELGYCLTWSICDAQYHGVAQRRRRVFIVASLGDGRSAQVLLKRESSAWDPPPSREAGQGTSRDVAASIGVDSEWNADTERIGAIRSHQSGGSELFVAFDWQAGGGGNDQSWNGKARSWIVKQGDYTGALSGTKVQAVAFDRTRGTSSGDIAGPLRKCGAATEGVNDAKADTQCVAFQPRYARNGRGAPDTVAAPLTAEAGRTGKEDSAQCVAFDYCAQGSERTRIVRSGEYAQMIAGRPDAVSGPWGVRRLTPTECRRLQGFPDDWNDGQSDSAAYRQLGNAVCEKVARWLGMRLQLTQEGST